MTGSIAITMIAAALLAACGEQNPAYCRAHPEDTDCPRGDGGPDVDAPPVTCDSADDCMAPTPVCKLSSQICVQCTEATEATECTGNKPVCEPTLDVCRACSAHSDCSSAVCLPDGSCAPTAEVSYVDGAVPLGSTTCSQAAPCPTLEEGFKPTPARRYLKLTGAITDSRAALIDNRNVTIFAAPGASLNRSNTGDVCEIKGTSNVTIHDLTIRNATNGNGLFVRESATVTLNAVKIHGNAGSGILFSGGNLTVLDSSVYQNTTNGISATAGMLTVRDSSVYENPTSGITAVGTGLLTIGSSVIAFNGTTGTAGVGLSINSDFSITNTIIAANGGTLSTQGGVVLATSNPAAVFQFNTVANNRSSAGVALGKRGINCTAAAVALTNSIVADNDVAGACTVTYSLTAAAIAGTGNKVGDPMFLDVGSNALVAGFYRIATGSPARDSANPAATLAVDIDGDPRPTGAADMGADEAQ
ncbi:MAG: right-handed parallel beta-helix repeat-containing protein [Deltaproteobacteria bacterium]|nr:right-handed parallel beta-helix repeat-containing protein [Deltaproteobacteria bacterium]